MKNCYHASAASRQKIKNCYRAAATTAGAAAPPWTSLVHHSRTELINLYRFLLL
jgi:hypothetical protein